jgi:hypothetical protein
MKEIARTSMANRDSRLARRLILTGCALAVAGALAFVGNIEFNSTTTTATSKSHVVSGTNSQETQTHLSKAALSADVVDLFSTARTVAKAPADVTTSAGMPKCAAPAIPAATNPPGHTYGVPFLAAITDGELLTGYDEWTANNYDYVAKGKTYHLYPWQSSVDDITGWVTGLLQLPNLSATIQPSGIVFCDGGGSTACSSANPPAGECIRVSLGGQPNVGQPPIPPLTNMPAPGKTCAQTTACLPYYVTLQPSGPSTLTVTGVASNGSLELSVSAEATTTVSLTEGKTTQTCTNGASTINVSTVPTSLPATAPPAPNAGNPDFRGLQLKPSPLEGPLASASSTLTGNDFKVGAFAFPPTTACPSPGISDSLNSPLGGWDTSGNPIYYAGAAQPIASNPGWAQFQVTTTVVKLELPVGPPANFNF